MFADQLEMGKDRRGGIGEIVGQQVRILAHDQRVVAQPTRGVVIAVEGRQRLGRRRIRHVDNLQAGSHRVAQGDHQSVFVDQFPPDAGELVVVPARVGQ